MSAGRTAALYRITSAQRKRASTLITRECCNCEDGNCIVLRRIYQQNDFPAEYHLHTSLLLTCCRTTPVNRWRQTCWGMQTPAFWNAPIAIPSWRASSGQHPCWQSGFSRRRTKPGNESKDKCKRSLPDKKAGATDILLPLLLLLGENKI